MSTIDDLATLLRWRRKLAALGIPADDLDDEAVMREARLRVMAEMLGRCTELPSSRTKRFVASVQAFRIEVTPKQDRVVAFLWRVHRINLRSLRMTDATPDWPDFLPPIPEG